MSRLLAVIAAELVKLRGLPAAPAAAAGTVIASLGLSAAIEGSNVDSAAIVPLLQVGTVLIGVLTVAPEYAGGQIRTSFAVTPDRLLLLAGKVIAYLCVAVAVSSAALVGAGAAIYLVLIGLLALAVTVLIRSLVGALATMLGLLLVVSPLLGALTVHARWLPGEAGSVLYRPGGADLFTPLAGALVLGLWVAVVSAVAAAAFVARDA